MKNLKSCILTKDKKSQYIFKFLEYVFNKSTAIYENSISFSQIYIPYLSGNFNNVSFNSYTFELLIFINIYLLYKCSILILF